VVPPEIISRGFVHQQSSEVLLGDARQEVIKTVSKLGEGNPEWAVLKNTIRESMSKYLYEQIHRRPMVIPVVVEV
jgi:ribonuclease J